MNNCNNQAWYILPINTLDAYTTTLRFPCLRGTDKVPSLHGTKHDIHANIGSVVRAVDREVEVARLDVAEEACAYRREFLGSSRARSTRGPGQQRSMTWRRTVSSGAVAKVDETALGEEEYYLPTLASWDMSMKCIEVVMSPLPVVTKTFARGQYFADLQVATCCEHYEIPEGIRAILKQNAVCA
ncbi:hypothetical protein B0H19DRAFT_1064882 [Mycena capillaripes]|nr:hypothetical protein B0H19DRAFT_1064882 [Mycena capillaripes]